MNSSRLPEGIAFPEELGGAVAVPTGWDRVETGQPGIAAYAEQSAQAPFRSNLSVVREERDMPLERWQQEADRMLAEALPGYTPLQVESQHDARAQGDGVIRRTAQYLANGQVPVAMVQWCWMEGSHGITVTLSASPVHLAYFEDLITAQDVLCGLTGGESA